jgi:hypothetical protein
MCTRANLSTTTPLLTDSNLFQYNTPLLANASYTSPVLKCNNYNRIQITLYADQTGTITLYTSSDNSNWDSTILNYSANSEFTHEVNIIYPYFKLGFVNGSVNQTAFRVSLMLSGQSNTAIMYGIKDNGTISHVAMTGEGHIEVAIHDPVLPFGSLHVESLYNVFQIDAVYGVNLDRVLTGISGSGVVTNSDSMFSISSGTTIYSQAFLQSRKRLRYRAG